MGEDKLHENWDSVYQKSLKLADMIEAHCQQSGERFDAMVVVPRGGYYPVNIVARRLGFKATDLLQASLSSYGTGENLRPDKFKFGQMPQPNEVLGRNLLIIDEICDTGQTLRYLVDYLKDSGAGLIRCGVLHYKPGSSVNGYAPDWFVETTDKWVVYPWEEHDRGD